MTQPLHIAHLINPVRKPGDIADELTRTQALTFESMRIAAEHASPHVKVDLLTTQYGEDHPIIPDYFTKTPDLERSVADVHPFTVHRKLPILCDLIERLVRGTEATCLVYTNVDIIVHPTFYREIAERAAEGLDAFIINRRRVPGHLDSVDDLPEIFELRGKPHPGFDCFVFHRSLYERFVLAEVCVGIPFIGILFAQNMFCHSQRFRLFDKDVLTYHVGMEVFKKRDPEYFAYNKAQFWQAIETLFPILDSRKFPWGDRNVVFRMLRWGLHPSIPIRLALRLEPRRWGFSG